jgi:hypothetical protein
MLNKGIAPTSIETHNYNFDYLPLNCSFNFTQFSDNTLHKLPKTKIAQDNQRRISGFKNVDLTQLKEFAAIRTKRNTGTKVWGDSPNHDWKQL